MKSQLTRRKRRATVLCRSAQERMIQKIEGDEISLCSESFGFPTASDPAHNGSDGVRHMVAGAALPSDRRDGTLCHGLALKAAIRYSKLLTLEGAGHKLHRRNWPIIIHAIKEHAEF